MASRKRSVCVDSKQRVHASVRTAGRAAETRYANEVTGVIVRRLEDYFDLPYPYAKLDSVAVPHFLGAMENRGLKKGVASLCIGGGEATAIAVERA